MDSKGNRSEDTIMALKRRWFMVAGIIILFLAIATGILYWLDQRAQRWHIVHLEPNTEFYSVDPGIVTAFHYNTQEVSLTATHKKSADSDYYEIEVTNKLKKSPSKKYRAGKRFLSAMSSFFTFKVVRDLGSKENVSPQDYPVDLGEVIIMVEWDIEPEQWHFKASQDHSAVVAIDELQAFTVDIPYSAFQTFMESPNHH
jgi:hypothetical protein